MIYTTNSIEALHRQLRKIIKTRGHFPTEDAARKLIYLAITKAETKWKRVFKLAGRLGRVQNRVRRPHPRQLKPDCQLLDTPGVTVTIK